jgi:hypothetical protein
MATPTLPLVETKTTSTPSTATTTNPTTDITSTPLSAPYTIRIGSSGMSTRSHVILYAAGNTDDQASSELLSTLLFNISGRRLQCIPDVAWLRSIKLHADPSNDGARARIPIVIGNTTDVWKVLALPLPPPKAVISTSTEKKSATETTITATATATAEEVWQRYVIGDASIQWIVRTVTYSCITYIPNLDPPSTLLHDTALVVTWRTPAAGVDALHYLTNRFKSLISSCTSQELVLDSSFHHHG